MTVVDITQKNVLKDFVEELTRNTPLGSLILLSGDLGVGKTEFVRLWLESIGIKSVTSPTFSLHQEYKIKDQVFHHFDFYRVNNFQELENMGLDEILESQFDVAFVEWPKNFFDQDSRIRFHFEITLDPNGKRILRSLI